MDEDMDTEVTDIQSKSNRADRLRPYQWKKGQSGNPAGRPKTKTLKEYARDMLASMTDEEREAFFHGMDKKDIWEMAEGKAPQSIDHTTLGKELPQPILNLDVLRNDSNKENRSDEQTHQSGPGGNVSE